MKFSPQTDAERDMATPTITIDIPQGPQRSAVQILVGRARYAYLTDISEGRCWVVSCELSVGGDMTVSIEEATLIAQALEAHSELTHISTRETNGARRAAERIRRAMIGAPDEAHAASPGVAGSDYSP